MALTNPNDIVTEERLSEFYQGILPYLGAVHGSPPKPAAPVVYGIRILRDESVPSEKIVYLEDAVGMTPAAMNFSTGVFDYGSWADAFFMPKPCMLKYDGTVDYYLDPNDYAKKEDGTASDVANTSYAGNAMMEWPKIWLKIVPDTTKDNKQADIFISNEQVDENYTDWNYHDSNGNSVYHFYTSIYNVSAISNTLRSISGQVVSNKGTFDAYLTLSNANNTTSDVIWTMETIVDLDLINILLMLISKSTNAQDVFGQGITTSGTETLFNAFRTGVHNTKGLFYGTNSGAASSDSNAVKIFGMENWWGFQWRWYAGHVYSGGNILRKLTYSTEDGSTTTGYNSSGTGYISSGVGLSGNSNSGITGIYFSSLGLIATSLGGSSTTYYCDNLWYSNRYATPALCSGDSYTPGQGPFVMIVDYGPNNIHWSMGSSISARPLS